MRTMQDLDLAGRRVLIREDLNVPIKDGVVSSDARIRAALPTIRQAVDAGAAVMLMSHLGRPTEGQPEKQFSLQPVADHLETLLDRKVKLVSDWIDGVDVAVGEIVLLENVRFLEGEKADDVELAQKMAALCDVFVMDAFGTAHRAQASTHGVAKFAPEACAGPLLAAELDALDRALSDPGRPVVAIVGGSKVSNQTDGSRGPLRVGRSAHRWRRHRKHVHRGGRTRRWQVAVRARHAGHRAASFSTVVGRARGGSSSHRRGRRRPLCGGRESPRASGRSCWQRTR